MPPRTRPRIIDSIEAARALLAAPLARAPEERLYVAHLAANAALLGVRIRFSPIAGQVDLPIRGIVEDAFALKSHALLLAHNHPSGDPTPTRADIAATRKLAEVLNPLGVRLFDHLIFANAEYVSFRASGLL